MLFMALMVAAVCAAKDIKTVVFKTSPEMHCNSCEEKIKGNLRFEKGVKDIVTNLEDKTVTVQYDADKTNVEKLIAGFAKINYVATVYDPAAAPVAQAKPAEAKPAGGCCGSGGCGCGGKKKPAAEQTVATTGGGCGSGGCGCGGKKKPVAETAAVTGNVVKFKADQMHCGGCAGKVKKLLTAADGVNGVEVDLDTKIVAVNYDASKTDADKLQAEFSKINYTVERVN